MTQPDFDARMDDLRARVETATDWREQNTLAAERAGLEIARPDLAADYHARRWERRQAARARGGETARVVVRAER